MKKRLLSRSGICLPLGSAGPLAILAVLTLTSRPLSAVDGIPHAVFGRIRYSDGLVFPSSIHFQAFVQTRPLEILTEDSTGCGYLPSTGQWWVQCANFPTAWSAGQILHVDFVDNAGIQASVNVTLTYNPTDEASQVILIRTYRNVTITTDPPGLQYLVDGITYSTEHVFSFLQASIHSLEAPSTQFTPAGTSQYDFQSWSDGLERVHSYTVPDHDETVFALFEGRHFLEVLSEHGVTFGEGWYEQGDSASFGVQSVSIVQEDTQHVFSGWNGSGTGSYTGLQSSFRIRIDGPVVETAVWNEWYFLHTSVEPEGGGNVIPAPPGTWGLKDSLLTIQAVSNAEAGYGFSEWTGDCSGNLNPTALLMDRPKSVTASFIFADVRKPILSWFYPSPGSIHVPGNAPITFTVSDPQPGDGCDPQTFSVTLNGVNWISSGTDQSGGKSGWTSTHSGLRCVLRPNPGFNSDQTVTVRVRIKDFSMAQNPLDTTVTFVSGNAALTDLSDHSVGPEGGVFTNDKTGVRVTFPAMALRDSMEVFIGELDDMAPLPDFLTIFGAAQYLGPDGVVTTDSILIRLPYLPTDLLEAGSLNPMNLPVYGYFPSEGQWRAFKVVSTAASFVYIKSRTFGHFTFGKDSGTGNDHGENPRNPNEWTILPNYPNPFNPWTTIPYSVPRSGRVLIEVVNPEGKSVRSLLDAFENPGIHEIRWDGTDDNGCSVGTGIYFIVLKNSDRTIAVQKAILLK